MKPLKLIVGLLLAVSAAPVHAALPLSARYAIDCVPGDNAAGTMAEWLRTRLTLRGFEEDAAHPTLRLCFRVRDAERVVPDYSGFGIGVGFGHRWRHGFGGAFWDVPVYRVELAREAILSATRAGEPAAYWEDREPVNASLEAALRRLIERLPAPHTETPP
ncbi:hypothetical protein [Crenobacter cavernae]|uniref:DUF4136 domain-containing protein n=1 Tax=Crenobacter cavernae TaxID=2290923 RepID=A0ABY0FDQ6_9NEIS|nr:hypothetical protein [Crenobacter cavernae]RXZ44373.1 hypothetical protein EBB06_04510 [Crenobacter cavernae]